MKLARVLDLAGNGLARLLVDLREFGDQSDWNKILLWLFLLLLLFMVISLVVEFFREILRMPIPRETSAALGYLIGAVMVIMISLFGCLRISRSLPSVNQLKAAVPAAPVRPLRERDRTPRAPGACGAPSPRYAGPHPG